MIFDSIHNLSKYEAMNPHIVKVVDFLAKLDYNNLPKGKVTIDGEDVYVNFIEARGKTRSEAILETHNKMIDIQIVFDDIEEIGWTSRMNLPEVEYHDNDDYSLYIGPEPQQYIQLSPGNFVLFFPEDAHAPCISDVNSYKKAIFKLKV